MIRDRGDSWLAIGLLLVLITITIVAAVHQASDEAPIPLSPSSTSPDGARALWLWLGELGYAVSDELFLTFRLPEEASICLMLEPSTIVTDEEWEALDDWVESGGLLILAGDGLGMGIALRHYGFQLNELGDFAPVGNQSPLLRSPPVEGPLTWQTSTSLEPRTGDFVTLLAVEARPVVVTFTRGTGRVILSASAYPFSNAGLKESGNPALALNLVASASRGGSVWFDEWHHGLRASQLEVTGPGNWLRYTPAGRSVVYTALMAFLFLVLQGQRFGPPVPVSKATHRRAPLEYITALANLSRRAGHRQAVLRQNHHWLKRTLGKRYRLDPTLPDDEFVDQLSKYNPNLNAGALRGLLGRLRRSEVSEGEFVRLAADVARWTEGR